MEHHGRYLLELQKSHDNSGGNEEDGPPRLNQREVKTKQSFIGEIFAAPIILKSFLFVQENG